ncbi:hypothetical protein FHP88_15730 [Sedimenticola selenatireducens]|uniref:Bacteriophage Mu GpT domain-containing protein n=1 Tax=Sedimenticola selenatireducens TaxID=191960 RepID=A0A557S0F5_9GAMM|nr:hypothetical protein [Sedimenticola selenatireducens]TVO70903.1 hypothetical protein FHP88_15730 [Sedimenticola selenatireducens]
MNKKIPAEGIQGEERLREATAGDFRSVIELVSAALRGHLGQPSSGYIEIDAIYPDRVVVRTSEKRGHLMAYPYTLSDDNQVQFGTPQEVVLDHKPVRAVEALDTDHKVLEALDDTGHKYRICIIQAGTSKNRNHYTDTALKQAVSDRVFEGMRVFVKSDDEHIRMKGKDVRNLIGRVTETVFVPGKGSDQGSVEGILEMLNSSGEIASKVHEAVKRNMASDLFGFSIDADVRAKKAPGGIQVISKFTKAHSLDLIVEPSAGGGIINVIEAVIEEEEHANMALRQRMIEAIKGRNGGALPEGLDIENEEAVLEAYSNLNKHTADDEKSQGAGQGAAVVGQGQPAGTSGVTQNDLSNAMRMVEARSHARVAIAESGLPDKAKARLNRQFADAESFSVTQVTEAIREEREYLASVTESGKPHGLGGDHLQAGEDRSEKVERMLEAFFDPDKPAGSFKQIYIDITGDKGVSGLTQDCDMQRLREAVGESRIREAVSAATFGNVLGNSITRAMLREYGMEDQWSDWRWLTDIVSVTDFRTQERTRMGGYGDLPVVAQNGSYDPLTTPGDEKATYALEKKGGSETLSLEAIANDDVGVIQRIPLKMAVASKRTLYKFVLAFLDANPTIYDTTALFTVGHGNLGSAALSATSYAARRLAMLNQAELSSNEKLGLVMRHLAVPSDLEETSFDLFVRNTNNDETFVQSRKPTVHVVPHWTDANNWFGTADKREIPLIELGFYNGKEEPELFIQDNPSQGSLFSNDQIKYKIRHIYKGAVMDFRGFQGSIVA